MADTHLIEIAHKTVGVAERGSTVFRFFASRPAFFPLEGRLFESPKQAQPAALALRNASARLTSGAEVASPRLDRSQP